MVEGSFTPTPTIVLEPDETPILEPIPSPSQEWALPTLPVQSEDPMAICNLFPDPNFALWVAVTFDREMQDIITFEELAAYKGGLDLGIGSYTYASAREDGLESYPFQDLTGIGYFTGATYLDFYKNQIREIPAEIGNCINLREINCTKAYYLQTIPPEIGRLERLERVWTGLTSIEYIPEEMCDLPNLKEVNLGAGSLKELPENIGNLQSLEFLDVHSNDLDHLPDSICQLVNLKDLRVSHNPKIAQLPKNFGDLASLETLDLFGCDIKHLPTSMKNMTNLQYLNVYDNYNLDEEYKDWFFEGVYKG